MPKPDDRSPRAHTCPRHAPNSAARFPRHPAKSEFCAAAGFIAFRDPRQGCGARRLLRLNPKLQGNSRSALTAWRRVRGALGRLHPNGT